MIENKKNVNNLFYHEGISKELCKTCLKQKQEPSVFRISMRKITKFLNRIHVDIDENLSITFCDNKYSLLIQNDAIDMFFVYLIKTKDEILKQLQAFKRWVELQKSKFFN